MAANMKEIKQQGVKVVVNAGGINCHACRDAVLAHAKKQGIELNVGIVLGDDLMPRQAEFRAAGTLDMFKGTPFPSEKDLMSCN
eukprot:gene11047-2065_t